MGTYCELYVADFPVFSSKSAPSPLVMTLFRARDKRVFARKCIERNPIAWGHADWDAHETETVVEYTATVHEVRSRLDIVGFTLARTQTEFGDVRDEHIRWLEEMNEDRHLWDDEIALLKQSDFKDFLAAFNEIITSGVHTVHFSKQRPTVSKLAFYVLKDNEDFYWRFPCRDIRCFFRALLEIAPESAYVTQDLTDLVGGGYFEDNDDVVEIALEELKGDYPVNSRIILLTEGSTDAEVLRASLQLLYPHLYDYYSFMDIAVRAPGGAGSLVHVVKSFAGAGIENRAVALFDNDAAGHSAVSSLWSISLPPNIVTMTYPDIDLARNYPTLGPGGLASQDVNGSAASIELYFGRDVLALDGELVPVQWKAYDERVRRYQGEVQYKDQLKRRFFEKIEVARASGATQTQGWEDMRKLLEAIFRAFQAQQAVPADRAKTRAG